MLFRSQATPLLGEIRAITEAFRQDLWTGVDDADLAVCERVLTRLLGNLGAL